ncbi:hypothetical protein C8R47DRAFT_1120927 [Mycena vitilis]|nr:hypothetical protein C8R47DRAFT_1120927 [Mycena vitilis]
MSCKLAVFSPWLILRRRLLRALIPEKLLNNHGLSRCHSTPPNVNAQMVSSDFCFELSIFPAPCAAHLAVTARRFMVNFLLVPRVLWTMPNILCLKF